MIGRETMHRRAMRLALLLASALAVPASTAAVPTDDSGIEAEAPRRVDTPTTPSLWDRPAASAPVVVSLPAEPNKPEPERTPSANPLWAVPLAILSNARERPIFSPTRRPPPPAVAAAPVANAPLPPPKPPFVERPQLLLVGTIAGDAQSFGIFVDQTTKAALRLKIGENYQGWRLRAVRGREVTLERDQQTATLSLPQPGTVAPTPMRMQAENATRQGNADSPPPRGGHR